MGDLKCKGWAKMSVAAIRAIPGLTIQVKIEEQSEPPDPDYLEILGVPQFTEPDALKIDVGRALAKTVVESRPVPRR